MDDEGFLKELLVEMKAEIQGALTVLRKSVSSDDTKQIQHSAHAIKGTAANLYVERVSDAASKLEYMAKGNIPSCCYPFFDLCLYTFAHHIYLYHDRPQKCRRFLLCIIRKITFN